MIGADRGDPGQRRASRSQPRPGSGARRRSDGAYGQRAAPVRVRPRARLPLRGRSRRGRPRLAGRSAGGRRGPLRPRAPHALRPPRPLAPERLQAAHRGARGALPAGDAGGGMLGDRVALRAGDRQPRAARDEPRGPAHRAARGGACPAPSAWWTASTCPSSARAAGGDRRRLPQRGDRRGIRAGQGDPRPVHAPAAERHPDWDFETNVGYSTPEHRAAIATTASRRSTGCRSSRSPTRSWRWRARARLKRASTCSRDEQPAAGVDADSDRVESDLGRPGALEPALSQPFSCHRAQLPPLADPIDANAQRVGRAGPLVHGSRCASSPRRTRGSARRAPRGRARRSACGSCAR